jgi:hypothetical protein
MLHIIPVPVPPDPRSGYAPWPALCAAAVLLAGLSSGVATPVRAQDQETTCSGKIQVGFVYAVMVTWGSYEYRAYVRNMTRDTLSWTLSLGSFPVGVTPPLEHQ